MVIPVEIGYDLNYYSIKLTSFTDSQNVGVTLSDFVGLTLTGGKLQVLKQKLLIQMQHRYRPKYFICKIS